MKNPFQSLKKLNKKEVGIFIAILVIFLIFFVIRKSNGSTTTPTYALTGDSTTTQNQLSDMTAQSTADLSAIKDTMATNQDNTNQAISDLKFAVNDLVSYTGEIKNAIPDYTTQFAQVDNSIQAVKDSNSTLADLVNSVTDKIVNPTVPVIPTVVSAPAPAQTASTLPVSNSAPAKTSSTLYDFLRANGMPTDNASVHAVADNLGMKSFNYREPQKQEMIAKLKANGVGN